MILPFRFLANLWRNVVVRRGADGELDDELESYVEILADEKMKAGASSADARRAALIELGGRTQVRENVRRVRAGALLDSLRTDLRYTLRSLARTPVFTITATICLGVGIGTNAAVFSVVDTVLHPSYGFPVSDDLVVLRSSRPAHGIPRAGVAYPDFTVWRDRSTSFAGIAGMTARGATLTGRDEPVQLDGAAVSWNLFPLLGAQPAFGRAFRSDDDRRGAPGTVLLGHDAWTRHFRGDSSVLGRVIGINGQPHTVIGVMPERFAFPQNAMLWVPLTPVSNDTLRGVRSLTVFARLGAGITKDRAISELRGIAASLAAEYPESNDGWSANLGTVDEQLGSNEGEVSAMAMMGAVTFVLLIVCTNVANLMLARGTARRREIAVRFALGATRGRTIRMLLMESAALATLGGALAIAVAQISLGLLDAAVPAVAVPYYIRWEIDRGTLIYLALVSAATALAFGLGPAISVSSGSLQQVLQQGRDASRTGRRSFRIRGSLIVAEVAVSVVLIVGATLFGRTILNLVRADPGFATGGMLNLRVNLPGARYAGVLPKTRFVDDVIARIEAVPGVVAATVSSPGPITGGWDGGGPIEVEGQAAPRALVTDVRWNAVTAHWFRAFDVPILRGRDFTAAEARDRSRVAIIDRTMAERAWPNEDPLGRRFRFTGDTARGWFTVIGVTPDVQGLRPALRHEPLAALPYPYGSGSSLSITIRTAGDDPLPIVPAVRSAIREIDPDLPVFAIRTMEELRRNGFSQTTVLGTVFSAFGLIALGLAAIGLYGVISYGVAQRTHEIGVRMALGARRAQVMRLFVGQGVRLALIGVAIGVPAAFAITRVLRNMLFGVGPSDPISFVAGTGVLVVAALVASSLPAWRAARVDPVRALRAD